jgi:hypothetical protein
MPKSKKKTKKKDYSKIIEIGLIVLAAISAIIKIFNSSKSKKK